MSEESPTPLSAAIERLKTWKGYRSPAEWKSDFDCVLEAAKNWEALTNPKHTIKTDERVSRRTETKRAGCPGR